MPRRETRERQRRARFKDLCAEFNHSRRNRRNPEAFWGLLKRIADSDVRLWAVADAASVDSPLHPDELAMVAEAAAPQLVRMTPRTSQMSNALRDKESLLGLRPSSSE